MTTSERVRAVIASSLHMPEEAVVPQARLHHDLGADSLDILQIAMALEEEFDLPMVDEDATMETVQELVDQVARQLAEADAACAV
jgi:acyl carrier protein